MTLTIDHDHTRLSPLKRRGSFSVSALIQALSENKDVCKWYWHRPACFSGVAMGEDCGAPAPLKRAGHPGGSRYHTLLFQQSLEEYGSIGGHELVMG